MEETDYTLQLPGAKIDDAEAWAYTHRLSNPSKTETDLADEVSRAKAEEGRLEAKINALSGGGASNMIETNENGFYVVDSNLNIGFYVDADGAHAKNLVEHKNE